MCWKHTPYAQCSSKSAYKTSVQEPWLESAHLLVVLRIKKIILLINASWKDQTIPQALLHGDL
uniref:Uncharacterized protein n=1 Tax=Aegilops tauschii subsp. strangulata TaxID=200361 RepID=A0A453RDM0_AEGTS